MDLTKILSIAGKPGLYKLVGEAKNNIIVESLIDGKRIPAFSHERISTLKEISIYTEGEDAPLVDVFKSIYDLEGGAQISDPKKMSSNDLKAYFEKVLPNYDKEAVYVSDIKKVLGWYNFLIEKEILDFTEEEVSEEAADDFIEEATIEEEESDNKDA